MTRLALALTVAFAIAARPAHAAMMEHYDLAGLVLHADAIVVADRTTPGHYRVVRVIRGSLSVGTELDVDDNLYETAGHALDSRAVVFLSHRDTGWAVTLSGLRVTEGGKVFRYEQWNNPGGWKLVPQGHDPEDNWRGDHAAVDLPTFERELARAIGRVDALAGAAGQPDPARRRAALLALLPPAGASRPRMGFYVDALTEKVAGVLGAAGDLEGALQALVHDHTQLDRDLRFAGLPDLLAFAASSTQPEALRVVALAAIQHHDDLFANAPAIAAVIALLADPSPAVRAAAVTAAAQTWQWGGGSPGEAAIIKKLVHQTHAAIDKLFLGETANEVLFAIADASRDGRLPSRSGGPAVATQTRVVGSTIEVDVTCLRRGVRLTGGNVTATHDAAPVAVSGFQIGLRCGPDETGTGNGQPNTFAPGRYALALELAIDRKPATLPLGTLVSDASGELQLR